MQNFCCRNEMIEISMILWSKFLVNLLHCRDHLDEKIYCFVLDVDFHVNDLVKSNYCMINAFKNAFRRRLNSVCALAWNQKIKLIETSCVCRLSKISNIFLDVIRCLCNNSRCCICTLVEKITKFFAFTSAHSERRRAIMYKSRRFVRDLSYRRISETKTKRCTQQSASTSFDVWYFALCQIYCMWHSYDFVRIVSLRRAIYHILKSFVFVICFYARFAIRCILWSCKY